MPLSPFESQLKQSNTYAGQLLQTELQPAFEQKGYVVEEEDDLVLWRRG